ncbi:phage terminase small subunit [Sinorhizobium fredii]
MIRDADGNARRNPALIVQQRAAATFAALAARLGLSAAQRARLLADSDEPVDYLEVLEKGWSLSDGGGSKPNGRH